MPSALRFITPPFRRESFETPRPVEDVRRAIAAALSASFFVTDDKILFHGKATSEGFSLRRVIPYRNDFRPVVDCRLIPTASGTRLDLRMRPQLITLIMMSIWLSMALLGVLAMFLSVLKSPSNLPGLAFTSALFAFGYLLCTVAFEFDARKIIPTLQQALQEPRS